MAFLLLCNYPVMCDLFSSLEAEYQRYLSRSCHNSGREHGEGRVSVKVELSRFFQKSPAGPIALKGPHRAREQRIWFSLCRSYPD